MEDSMTRKATLHLDEFGNCTISFDTVMLKDPSGLGYLSHPADGRLFARLGDCELTFVLPKGHGAQHHGNLVAVMHAKRELVKTMLTNALYAMGLLFALLGVHQLRFH
jgi:hypothetical protein